MACAVLAAGALLLAAAGPAAAAPQVFGFNEFSSVGNRVTPETIADLASQAGADTAVIAADWREVERVPGTYNWGYTDRLYAASLARGIKPIFTLLFAPNWTWAEGQSCTPDPRLCRFPPTAAHDDAWKEFARRVAARYPQLAAIQVWNEPNIPTFWDGGVNPERYTAMLKLAHAAIKAENPSMEVLGGALANWWGDDGPRGIADRRFLARMYAAGAKGHMDGVSLHPYPADIDLWQFFKALTDLRTVRDNAGDSDAKIWITEVGLSTTYQWFTDNDQAAMLSRIYRLARAMPDVRGLIIHTLLEPSQLPETDYLFGYGVMRPEPGLQPKPAYCALAAATGSAYRCPEGVAVNPGPREPAQVPRWDAQELIQAAADAARRYKASHGSYTGLTQADLAALDSRLSAQPADYGAYPGPAADPSRIGIWVFESAGQHLLVCNTSRADRSYCIWGKPDGSWVQGMAASVIYVAAAGTLGGSTWWW